MIKLLQGDCMELDKNYFNIAKERIEQRLEELKYD